MAGAIRLAKIAGKMASAGGLKGSGKIFPLIGRTAIPNRGYRVNELALLLAGGTREAFRLEAEAFPGSREARDAMEDTPDYRQALSLWQDTTAALVEIRAYPGVPDEATALRFEDALERQQAVGSLLSYYFNVRGEFYQRRRRFCRARTAENSGAAAQSCCHRPYGRQQSRAWRTAHRPYNAPCCYRRHSAQNIAEINTAK